jgi:hypothetical protein
MWQEILRPARNERGTLPKEAFAAVRTAIPCVFRTVLLCVMTTSFGILTAADTEPADAEITGLIQRLDSSSLEERVRAESDLLELGPAILDRLPTNDVKLSRSATEALRRIRTRLEQDQQRLALEPTTIEVRRDESLETACARWATETCNRLLIADHDQPVFPKPVSGELWSVVVGIAESHGLELVYDRDSRAMRFEPRSAESPWRWAFQGAAACRLRELSRKPFGTGRDRLTLEFELLYEPRLRPLYSLLRVKDIAVSGPEPDSVECWNPNASYEILPPPDGSPLTGRLELVVDEDVTFHQLAVRLPIETTVVTFDRELSVRSGELKQGARVDHPGVSLRIQSVEPSGNGQDIEVEATVAWDASGPAFESHRTWILHNRILTRRGTMDEVAVVPLEIDRPALRVIRFRARLDSQRMEHPDAEFIYEAPVVLTPNRLEFAFPVASSNSSDRDTSQ